MTGPGALPAGYTNRATTRADAAAVVAVVGGCEAAALGEAQVDVEDIESDWRRPGVDLDRDGVFVLDPSGEPVAYAELCFSRAEGNVLPAHRGRGIGAWLAAWIEARAREAGDEFVRQVVPVVEAQSLELLQRAGYQRSDTAWELELQLDGRQSRPPLAAGVEVRDVRLGTDDEAVFRVIEDAFAPWPNRQPSTLERWRALTLERAGFEPWMLPLVVRDGVIVGAAYLIDYSDEGFGWIQQLAVREDQRGLGLGVQLLHEAFDRLDARGRTRAGLSTDSRTGALGLYQRVGMSVIREFAGHSLRVSA